MKQLLLYLILFLLSSDGTAQVGVEAPPPSGTIPIAYTRVPPHLLATQFNFSGGTGRISHNDKQLLSGSVEVKGLYNITGAIYLSSGMGYTYLHSQTTVSLDKPQVVVKDATLAYIPSGIGFTLGDDRATIITGIDFLPGYYLSHSPEIENRRTFTMGYGPEFGFLFKAAPAYHKGILIGMVGKLQFMQRPDKNEQGLRYTYGGVGLVIRFY